MSFSDIKIGKIMLLKDEHVCKITAVNTSKTGKHGHMKKSCMGTDVFSGRKYNDLFTHHSLLVFPEYGTTQYLVMDVDDEGYFDLMHEESCTTRSDLKTPEGTVIAIGSTISVACAKWNDNIKEGIIIIRSN